MRHGVSTVALLAGQPKRMISCDLNHDPVAEILRSRQGNTDFSFVQGDSLSVQIEPCDLPFSRDPRDKHPLPGWVKLAANLTNSLASHVADGLQNVEAPELQRLR